MGAAKPAMNVSNEEKKWKSDDMHHRAPSSKPPFTLGNIKKAIPPHCFHRSLLRSFSYVVNDLLITSFLCYIAMNYIPLLPRFIAYVAWPIYWFCQGSVMVGVWIIGHECGHHAFSVHKWLDDTVGFIVHSAILTPYFSVKISHRRHHSNTASLEYDEVYVPILKNSDSLSPTILFKTPAGRALGLFIGLTLGWPIYLMFNVWGRPYDRFTSHFNPYSPIFSDRERVQILMSDAGVLATFYVLYRLVVAQGLAWVLCIYGCPLLVMNALLVVITFLHHTHPALPHYDSSEWDWLRGAMSTVDRDYGFLNKVFHNGTNAHVVHHLFSTLPHYHAVEATKAIKPILGDYYQFDSTPIVKAMWRSASECIYVDPDEGASQGKGVLWFTN